MHFQIQMHGMRIYTNQNTRVLLTFHLSQELQDSQWFISDWYVHPIIQFWAYLRWEQVEQAS